LYYVNRFSKRDDARHAETACVFRELNEEIAAIARGLPDDELPAFLCECGAGCTQHVSLKLAEYEEVRRHPLRFFVVHGHHAPNVDVVVEETERFCVVEKQAPVSVKFALARDPRRAARRTEPPGPGVRFTLLPLA
jgi:hypothetical protein